MMLFNDITVRIHSNGIDVNSFELLKKRVRVETELKPLVLVEPTFMVFDIKNFIFLPP